MWNLSDLSLRERDLLLYLSERTYIDLDPLHEGNFRAASRLAQRGIVQMRGFRVFFTKAGVKWFEEIGSLWEDLGD